ncbi:MAG: replication initiator protein [Microvirus sp.]|nr:MAG: replication initiator protein [Microvirus sp.]
MVYTKAKSLLRVPLTVPCGGCIGCRMQKAQEWSTRIAHEATLHEENSFLTLTYDDAHLPDNYSVSVREMQLFLKRLRQEVGKPVRFFACGEYGDKGGRPHYHLILFGYGFPDRTVWRKSPSGFLLYRSQQLEKVWPYGNSEIGTVTPSSGGYVARYVLKKVGGEPAAEHYERLHPLTGEIVRVAPEFATQSRNPGLGSGWIDKYADDCFPSDFIIQDGKKVPVPLYYSRKLEQFDEQRHTQLIRERRKEAHNPSNVANTTEERLETRQESAYLRAARLTRDLDQQE